MSSGQTTGARPQDNVLVIFHEFRFSFRQTALRVRATISAQGSRGDKGYGRRLVELGEIVNPAGIQTIGEFPNITAAMERVGWGEPKIRKIMGENWLRVLAEAWGEDSS